MKNPIKWYQSLRPAEKHRNKNRLIALVVLFVTAAITGGMFIHALTTDVSGNWAYAVQACAIGLGGQLIGIVYYVRAKRGKE